MSLRPPIAPAPGFVLSGARGNRNFRLKRAMLTLLRRFLVVSALMFWQGGFLFYASIVVPIGQEVLPTPQDQGFITRHVTKSMNVSGAVALLPLA